MRGVGEELDEQVFEVCCGFLVDAGCFGVKLFNTAQGQVQPGGAFRQFFQQFVDQREPGLFTALGSELHDRNPYTVFWAFVLLIFLVALPYPVRHPSLRRPQSHRDFLRSSSSLAKSRK